MSLTSPLAGEVAADAQRRRGGWGGGVSSFRSTSPHRLAALATSPSGGEVKTFSPFPSGRGAGGVGLPVAGLIAVNLGCLVMNLLQTGSFWFLWVSPAVLLLYALRMRRATSVARNPPWVETLEHAGRRELHLIRKSAAPPPLHLNPRESSEKAERVRE